MGILKTANAVLSGKKYALLFVLLSMGIFWVLFLVPDRIASVNSVARDLSAIDYVFLGSVSMLVSLIVTMQVFSLRLTGRTGIWHSALGGAGIASGFISAVFSSAACGLCVGALLGFLGAGSVIFLVDNRVYVVAGSVLLLFLSLYFVSKRVNSDCDTCHV